MAATGELVELLAKALRAAQRGANDRGIMSRARSGGGVLSRHNEFAPDIAERMHHPDRLWLQPNEMGVSRDRGGWGIGSPANPTGHIPPEYQADLDALSPLERAQWYRENGMADEFAPSAYERTMMRKQNPQEAARSMWGVDDPVARMALIGAGVGGGGLSLREVLRDRNQWSA